MQSQSAMLDKVRALLAKAASTEFEEEAEALAAKAQELIAKHSIDESLVNAKRSDGQTPSIVEMDIESPYASAKFTLLSYIAHANDCEAIWSSYSQKATLIGFSHDIEAIELMYTSLLLQATSSMLASGAQTDWRGRSRTKSFRQSFLVAYARRVGQRLHEAREAVVEEETAKTGTSVALVLASKREVVSSTMKEAFPTLGTFSTSISNGDGVRAGWHAGGTAQLHNQRQMRTG
jgi:hypothetical protein